MNVPTADPKRDYLAHKDEIDETMRRVLDGGRYILGEEVERFEREFAAYIEVAHAIGVGSGTEALHLALRACGIGVGDKVITVSHTAVATVAAIELSGATPVLVDVDPCDFTMDPASLEAGIERAEGVRAVVPVHLYGHPAPMPAIQQIAARRNLFVIEDCSQAHGAKLAGRCVGGFGHMAVFSFYPTKNLGAIGDGGAVVTGDAGLAERVRLLRQYGWRERYISEVRGMNSRLDELQAAILRVKLRYLDSENDRRRKIAAEYDKACSHAGLVIPQCKPGAEHVYHQYVVRTSTRDQLRAALAEAGVGASILYPQAVHQQPAYAGRIERLPLPQTEQICREILSLPMHPHLTRDEIGCVVEALSGI